ncbi:MAG: hypothetical protein KC455_10095 [Carnobacterium sp.]|nr:hypothetical protein [Carnobacterium sp.]
MKHNYLFVSLFLLFFLIGCSNKNEEAYNSLIQKGLDALITEEYEKAEAYFEFSLEEKPNDKKAKALLSQTKNFVHSLKSFNDKDYKIALEQANSVINTANGSTALITKSEALSTDIKKIMDEPDTKQDSDYSFDDFKGTYGLYESTPYESTLEYLIIITDSHFIEGGANAGISKSNILDKRIKDNILTIDWFTPEGGGYFSSSGILSLKMETENNQKKIIFTESGSTMYFVTEEQISEAGFILPPDL